MAILKDIEVKVTSLPHREVFQEYANPKKTPKKREKSIFSIERYIEARTGLNFQIEVFVKPKFKLQGAMGIRVDVVIDGGVVKQFQYYDKDEVLRAQKRRSPLVQDRTTKLEGTQYSDVNFSFGSLKINEEVDEDKDIIDEQAESLGCIQVNVDRSNRTRRSKPIPRTSCYHAPSQTDASKKLVKNRHVSHVMRPTTSQPRENPGMMKYHYELPNHVQKRLLTFTFRYRSHMSLQLLGCIPRSPTPVPIFQRSPEDLTETEKVEEVARLRADVQAMRALEKEKVEALESEKHRMVREIERLTAENAGMKDIKDKMTAFQTLMGGMTAECSTPTPPLVSLKRERIKEEDRAESSGGSASTRNRPSKRAKTVDLTAD